MISNKLNVTRRNDLDRPLTHNEVDANFNELRNAIDDISTLEQTDLVLAQQIENFQSGLSSQLNDFTDGFDLALGNLEATLGNEIDELLPETDDQQGKALIVKSDGSLAWDTNLKRYTVSASATSSVLDLAQRQVFRLTGTGARTVTFSNPPGPDVAMSVIITLKGTGTVTWPAGILWHENFAPALGSEWTRVALFWDGVEWTGSVSAKR